MKTILCALLFAAASIAVAQDVEPSEVLENVQKKYSDVNDAQAKFTQKVSFKYAKVEQSFNGTVKMKKGNRYRVESQQQTLVTDGKTVWLYTPSTKQVLIDSYKSDPRAFSPDRFLLGLPKNFQATLLNENASSVGADYVLKLAPKTNTESTKLFKSLKVWVAEKDWSVRKIEYVDMNDTRTVYTLSALQFDEGVPDGVFHFIPPAGAQVVDLRNARPGQR
ncbi:MAG: outer membrane lipoprotein chaperone LolA [Acidobacteriota bacterium]